jgi:leader peptidase (prepilin peptidase)/N-methyltransferase
LFATAILLVPFPTLLSVWVILSILVVTTFIDLEFFIIPDAMSKGGIAAGLLLSVLTPGLHNTPSRLEAVILALTGVFTGALSLYVIGELGKRAFGRYKVQSDAPVPFRLEPIPPDDRQIRINGEPFLWSEHFFRKSDRIVVHVTEAEINGSGYQNIDLTFFRDRVVVGREIIALDKIKHLAGYATIAIFPREAMGLGDVKLIAAIGSFVGWQGVLFTIAAASFLGATFGLIAIVLGKHERSAKIPFGPYLALASVIWLFWRDTLGSWYQQMM